MTRHFLRDDDLSPEQQAAVLDLAAGSGVWGVSLAEKSPKVRVTAVDWPGVLPVTRPGIPATLTRGTSGLLSSSDVPADCRAARAFGRSRGERGAGAAGSAAPSGTVEALRPRIAALLGLGASTVVGRRLERP